MPRGDRRSGSDPVYSACLHRWYCHGIVGSRTPRSLRSATRRLRVDAVRRGEWDGHVSRPVATAGAEVSRRCPGLRAGLAFVETTKLTIVSVGHLSGHGAFEEAIEIVDRESRAPRMSIQHCVDGYAGATCGNGSSPRTMVRHSCAREGTAEHFYARPVRYVGYARS